MHIGPHKTGSTSIQIFFNCQKSYIGNAGIYYPTEWNDSGAHHTLRTAITDREQTSIKNALCSWIQLANQDEIDRVFISSEDFEYLSHDDLSFFGDLASKAGFEISSYMFVRPQSDLIESQYSQHIREGLDPGDFEKFTDQCLQHAKFLRLHTIAETYAEVFGKGAFFLPYYDEQYKPQNVLRVICDAINIPTPPNRDNYSFNTKLNSAQLDVIRAVISRRKDVVSPVLTNGRSFAQIVKQIDWPPSIIAYDSYRLSKHALEKIRDRFAEPNRYLSTMMKRAEDYLERWYQNKIRSAVSFSPPDNKQIVEFAKKIEHLFAER